MPTALQEIETACKKAMCEMMDSGYPRVNKLNRVVRGLLRLYVRKTQAGISERETAVSHREETLRVLKGIVGFQLRLLVTKYYHKSSTTEHKLLWDLKESQWLLITSDLRNVFTTNARLFGNELRDDLRIDLEKVVWMIEDRLKDAGEEVATEMRSGDVLERWDYVGVAFCCLQKKELPHWPDPPSRGPDRASSVGITSEDRRGQRKDADEEDWQTIEIWLSRERLNNAKFMQSKLRTGAFWTMVIT
jgi:hypothetical protein